MSGIKDYRIGGIGCGSVFVGGHMPSHAAIRINGDMLVGFYDVDIKKAETARRIYAQMLQDYIDGKKEPFIHIWGYRPPEEEIIQKYKENLAELTVYKNVNEFLDNVDIVDVTTPHRWHVDYAVKALEHNVNVATEKPMGRTWWECRRIVEAAKKSKAKYQLSDNNAYDSGYLMFKKIMDAGDIGEISYIELYRAHGGPEQQAWFWNGDESGGGAMMDYGCHAVTLAQYLVGFDKKVVSVKSTGIRRARKNRPIQGLMQEIKVEDDVHMKILFEDPKNGNVIVASIEAGWADSLRPDGWIWIEGSEGEMSNYKDESNKSYVKVTKAGYGDRLYDIPLRIHRREPIMNAILSFIRALNTGAKSFTNEDYAITNMAILGAAFLSELKGRIAVTLDEFAEFCEEIAEKEKDKDIPLAIIRTLLKPYQ